MPARDLRVMTGGLEQLGYDSTALLAAAGLSGIDLDDPDGRVSCEAIGQLLTRAQQLHVTPNLALELAQLTPIGAYPLLDYLILTWTPSAPEFVNWAATVNSSETRSPSSSTSRSIRCASR